MVEEIIQRCGLDEIIQRREGMNAGDRIQLQLIGLAMVCQIGLAMVCQKGKEWIIQALPSLLRLCKI